MEQTQEQKNRLWGAYGTYTNTRAAANLGKLVGRIALQMGAKTATAIVMSPVGWIAIGVGIVVTATFLIVFSIGGPSLPVEDGAENRSPESYPTLSPALSPTPNETPKPTGSS